MTLGGLAGLLRDAAPDEFQHAWAAGLMDVHRGRAPDVVTAQSRRGRRARRSRSGRVRRILDAARLALWAGEAQ